MILKVIIIYKEKVNYSMPIERKLAAIMFTEKHLSYPIPKGIVEAWERVK